MTWSLLFFTTNIFLGIGLAMDAFSVSMANGLNEPHMNKGRVCTIAGVFGGFQALMPLIGWFCVHTIAESFHVFEKFIPWIALILLLFIGGKMLIEGIKNDCEEEVSAVSPGALFVQGIATSIDALSVGFTIAKYNWIMALAASLIIAIVSVCCNVVIGVIYGSISGYYGGTVDMIMMRIVDIIYSLPDMLIIILLSVVFNETLKPLITGTVLEKLGTNMISMFIVFGLLYWVSMARLIRGQILSIKNNEYVLAARCIGTKNARILRRHILPNCLSVIIITTALQVPSAIFTESYLSFLGLGVSAPLTSLGSLANDARAGMQSYPLRLVIPAIAICLIVLALNLLGDGLRDALDPKMKNQ